jgi:hypothetical protein
VMVVSMATVWALTTSAGLPLAPAASGSPPSEVVPTATAFGGVPTVGALFLDGADSAHACTASVVRSEGEDLALTSAHCVTGSGQGLQFAPGYHDGIAPYGLWAVHAAYVDPRWLSAQDPQHDYAFLVIAAQQRQGRSARLSELVAGNMLGLAPQTGQPIQVIAYTSGINDAPITCATRTYVVAGYPAFDCHGFVEGTSGAPWIDPSGLQPTIRGIIGGLHQGGCQEYTSFSSRFDQAIWTVYDRAMTGGIPDILPIPGDDNC